MRVAAIDIGTNTVLLLVAERDARGDLVALAERATITRLGEGVDRTRRLASEAVERTLACLKDYAELLHEMKVERLDVVGTSAMRDATAGDEFVRRAEAILGTAPRVISGDEEARLTFQGALGSLGLEGKVTVFDVGGGSTELVRGHASRGGSEIARPQSFQIGSVRLLERLVHHDPPLQEELAAARALVRKELSSFEPPSAAEPLVGIAGTVTTLAAVAKRIEPYDGRLVHGMRLSASEVLEVAELLGSMPLAERTTLPGLEPRRADVIVTGAAIVVEVLAWAQAAELIVSDRGVRWGLVEALASA